MKDKIDMSEDDYQWYSFNQSLDKINTDNDVSMASFWSECYNQKILDQNGYQLKLSPEAKPEQILPNWHGIDTLTGMVGDIKILNPLHALVCGGRKVDEKLMLGGNDDASNNEINYFNKSKTQSFVENVNSN